MEHSALSGARSADDLAVDAAELPAENEGRAESANEGRAESANDDRESDSLPLSSMAMSGVGASRTPPPPSLPAHSGVSDWIVLPPRRLAERSAKSLEVECTKGGAVIAGVTLLGAVLTGGRAICGRPPAPHAASKALDGPHWPPTLPPAEYTSSLGAAGLGALRAGGGGGVFVAPFTSLVPSESGVSIQLGVCGLLITATLGAVRLGGG